MAKGNRKHVFISHHHADDDHVSGLTNLLSRRGLDVRNSSIRAKPENQRRLDEGRVSDAVIRRLLRIKIAWAGKVIVLIGKETHRRPWVDWEIEQANKQGKQIIGVFMRGHMDAEIPEKLKDYASDVVPWNTESILTAIEGNSPQFRRPDGSPLPPIHSPASINC